MGMTDQRDAARCREQGDVRGIQGTFKGAGGAAYYEELGMRIHCVGTTRLAGTPRRLDFKTIDHLAADQMGIDNVVDIVGIDIGIPSTLRIDD
ncbi:MAG: hypothetical protein NVSMB6_02180 [Burkholderiaceae bacterium]